MPTSKRPIHEALLLIASAFVLLGAGAALAIRQNEVPAVYPRRLVSFHGDSGVRLNVILTVDQAHPRQVTIAVASDDAVCEGTIIAIVSSDRPRTNRVARYIAEDNAPWQSAQEIAINDAPFGGCSGSATLEFTQPLWSKSSDGSFGILQPPSLRPVIGMTGGYIEIADRRDDALEPGSISEQKYVASIDSVELRAIVGPEYAFRLEKAVPGTILIEDADDIDDPTTIVWRVSGKELDLQGGLENPRLYFSDPSGSSTTGRPDLVAGVAVGVATSLAASGIAMALRRVSQPRS